MNGVHKNYQMQPVLAVIIMPRHQKKKFDSASLKHNAVKIQEWLKVLPTS